MSVAEIRGYRGDVGDHAAFVRRVKGQAFLILRADRVYGADHLTHAAALAARAVADDRGRTADLATETLLYAAGERQVHKALALLGVVADTRAFATVAWDASTLDALATALGWARDDAVIEANEDALDALGITRTQRGMFPRARWGDLILEKIALLDVAKP